MQCRLVLTAAMKPQRSILYPVSSRTVSKDLSAVPVLSSRADSSPMALVFNAMCMNALSTYP